MKKALAIVALVAAMFVAGKVQAQSTVYAAYAPETFKASTTAFGQTYTNTTNYQGFAVGFNQNVKLYKGFGICAGAQFRMNMRNVKDNGTLVDINTKENQMLIDVPVLLNYSISINRDFSITPFVGPMLSLGLTGKTVTSTHENILNTTTETTYDWYGDNGHMNRFNLYLVAGGNIRFSSFNLFGGYRMGLLNVTTESNSTLKPSGMFVGLGFSL